MTQSSSSSNVRRNIERLGIIVPPTRPPVANYRKAVAHGDLLYLSGHGPADSAGLLSCGKVGIDVTTKEAYDHARQTGLNLLSTIEATLGSLDRVAGFVKLLGMVNAAPDFADHPRVINGCSDLLIEVFGEEIGGHARSAIGVGSLPGQMTVEIELILRFRP